MTEPPEEPDRHAPLRTLAILIILALATWAGWGLMQQLTGKGRLEDCLMSGRRNCMPIDADGNIQKPRT